MSEKEVCEANIISTGTELTYGQFADTNSAWIADLLTQCGVIVRQITIVGDRIDDIVKTISDGLHEKRRLIVITGGLGPSEDDMTIEAIAKALGKETFIGENALEMVRSRCNEFSIKVNERIERMARMVVGGDPIINLLGLAPGTMIKFGDTTIVALPGIPKEMKPMFENSILPIVRKWTNGKFKTVNLKIRLGGDRFQILRQIQIEYPEVYFKTHSKPPSHEQQGYADGIDVTLLVRGESIDNCNVVTDMILQRFQKLVDERNGKLDIIM